MAEKSTILDKSAVPIRPWFTTAQEPRQEVNPIPQENWSGTILEDEWGLKLKTVTYKDRNWKVLLVFTKDLDGESLASLRQAFQPVDPRKGVPPIQVCFYDADMVEIARVVPSYEGVLSGVKGDAVRFRIDAYPSGSEKARKAEFRGEITKKAK